MTTMIHKDEEGEEEEEDDSSWTRRRRIVTVTARVTTMMMTNDIPAVRCRVGAPTTINYINGVRLSSERGAVGALAGGRLRWE